MHPTFLSHDHKMRTNIKYVFNKRLYFILCIIIFLFISLLARLYFLQVIDGEKYKTLSDDNRIHVQIVPPNRGRILDRNGETLAENIPTYHAVLIREQTRDYKKSLGAFEKFITLSEETKHRIHKQVKQLPRRLPIILKRNLNWDEIATLEVNAVIIPGIVTQESSRRNYKDAPFLSHVTGYTSAPTEADIDADKGLQFPDSQTGKQGIEKIYDEGLSGRYGRKEVEINALGQLIRQLSFVDPSAGEDTTLTVDSRLQSYGHSLFSKYKSGAAVVLDIDTGGIIALISYPGYDANLFPVGISHKEWTALQKNPQNPLTNKVISGLYSPASLIKVILGLAALEKDPHILDKKFYCDGTHKVGNHIFHCWKKHGHGHVNFQNAFLHSCDVYFYNLAQKIGPDIIATTAKKFGLGAISNIDLPGEKSGQIPTPDWKKNHLKENWYTGDTVLLSIGQGSMLTTPLQWAIMLGQIANGGYKITPHIYKHTTPPESIPLKVSPHNLDVILSAMNDTTNKPTGTGYSARIRKKGFEMAGKTATAQVRRISMQERKSGIRRGENLPWFLRDNSLFIGFAPVNKPKYVVAVIVEHAEWGRRSAAPIGRDLLLKVQELMAHDGDKNDHL